MPDAAPALQQDPAQQLDALAGLKIEFFHEAIQAGEAERRTSTPDDPPNAGGSRDYFGRVRRLREILRSEKGWKRYNVNGLPLVVNEAKTIAIGVVLGDAQTGVPGMRQPRSKRPVGEIKQSLVIQNQQDALFDLPSSPQDAVLDDEEISNLDTWFLVTCRRRSSKGKVTVHSELSLAVKLDIQGYVVRWDPRICLPPLEFEGVIGYIEGTDDGPTEFEVPVEEH
ncbi:MAG: hypothetical protein JWO67_2473 [Streptosporangiaceae bacterium]|nr:hypothetical protein [Streptosporangiaceae bacterium]